jgi:sulfur transfer protein SufE
MSSNSAIPSSPLAKRPTMKATRCGAASVRYGYNASADGQAILHYRGDSDSHLVRGLIAISISLFSDRAPKQILAVDALGAFRALGLEQHLTPQRSNGARAMIERMRADAAAA